MAEHILVSTVVIKNTVGHVLTVRKRGTHSLMLPGGKLKANESPERAAVREFAEELGVDLDLTSLRFLGEFTAPAANEHGHHMTATVFEHPFVEIGSPRAEIEHVEWVDPVAGVPDLAPLLKDAVFPALLGKRRRLRLLTVFTGSASGYSPAFADAADDFARYVVSKGCGIVYGGGRVGLMGAVADAALSAGGDVFGVMPQSLVDGEIAHQGLTKLEVVPDMHTRKNRMADLGDGFVALPGGAGTLEELFEVWTWQQLGIHAKPVALYDVNGFWQPLLIMLDQMTEQGFLSTQFRDSLIVASDPEALLDALTAWVPPPPKWSKVSDGSVRASR